MSRYYRFSRGLGKKEIGIAVYCCLNCRKTGVSLWAVEDNSGNKAYACDKCKSLYTKFDKHKKNV